MFVREKKIWVILHFWFSHKWLLSGWTSLILLTFQNRSLQSYHVKLFDIDNDISASSVL